MTMYIDIIFLENVVMNSIILLATATILKIQIKVIRIIISSVFGSLYAIAIYTTQIEVLSNIFLKITLSILMIHIAFNSLKPKQLLKELMIFYLTSFTFGGVSFALLYFVRPQDILFEKGVLIGVSPIKIILAGGILGFLIITVSFKNIKGRLTRKDTTCNLTIYFKR